MFFQPTNEVSVHWLIIDLFVIFFISFFLTPVVRTVFVIFRLILKLLFQKPAFKQTAKLKNIVANDF